MGDMGIVWPAIDGATGVAIAIPPHAHASEAGRVSPAMSNAPRIVLLAFMYFTSSFYAGGSRPGRSMRQPSI